MSNPSKKKGTEGETKVSKFLNARGVFAERKALAGEKDKGDLRVVFADGTEVTVEVKSGMQTASPSRSLMAFWLKQAVDEGKNAGTLACALVVVRYRHKLCDAEVWIPGEHGRTMMYLDEFARIKDAKEIFG